MTTLGEMEKFNSQNPESIRTYSDSKCKIKNKSLVYNYLKAEVNKRKDLKIVKEKLGEINEKDEYNMIYKLKLEKSKGDSLFSSVNDNYGRIGSSLGVRTSSYLDHAKRFEQSKELISEATKYQRNMIRGFTDCLFRQVWRHRFNYFVKGSLTAIFLYNLCKANENKKLYLLRKIHPANSDILKFYYNSVISFGFASLAFIMF